MSLTRDEFNNMLKGSNLTKRDFCNIVGLNYNSVNNWGSGDIKVPDWVKSWLRNYEKSKRYDKIKELTKDI